MTVAYGNLPFTEQIQFFLAKVNMGTRRWDDVWKEQHDTAFMVAGAYEANLLGDLRAAVDAAITEGTPLHSLALLQPTLAYTSGEDTREDKYLNPYFGKVEDREPLDLPPGFVY